MSKPIVRIHNIETDEVVDREMTNAEFAIYKKEQELVASEEEKEIAKAEAKAALLERLGITAEEAQLLLS
jgi:hypothetical protein